MPTRYLPNPSLAPMGKSQARKLAKRLSEETIDHIFTSPLTRTLETAIEVAKVKRCRVKVEPALCEFLSPDTFQAPPDLQLVQPALVLEQWLDSDYRGAPLPRYPETAEDLSARVKSVLEDLTERYGGSILCVTHKAVIVSAVAALVDSAYDSICYCCGINLLEPRSERWGLVVDNCVQHLD